jgi:hypothetical protein
LCLSVFARDIHEIPKRHVGRRKERTSQIDYSTDRQDQQHGECCDFTARVGKDEGEGKGEMIYRLKYFHRDINKIESWE